VQRPGGVPRPEAPIRVPGRPGLTPGGEVDPLLPVLEAMRDYFGIKEDDSEETVRERAFRYFPVNRGARFSWNARTASRWSSVAAS
jgi:hypothetical protein